MADDQVKYSDLIVDDGGIKALEDALNGIKMQMKELKSTAVVLGEALKNTSSANDSGRKSIRSAAVETDALAKALRARQEAESKLAIEIAKVKEETREANAMAKYQAQLVDAAAGSYKALSAQYSINKIILNSMSAEERKATEEGKKLEAETKAIYEEMKKLQEATGKHQLNVGNYADATKGLRAQIMDLTEAMVQLRMEGKENTSEYADLQKKAGELKDAFADAQKEVKNMASDTSNLDTALGALSAASGGFAAVTGAMQLMGAESEDVQEAQKKLQASIALVNGVTAVQTNLQHQSALMLGVSKVQTYALAKAEAYERLIKIQGSSATWGAVAAQKAFNLVAKANPYVLLATAFVTVVGAIWAFSAAAKKAAQNIDTLYQRSMRVRSLLAELKSEANKTFQDTAIELRLIVDELGNVEQGTEEWKTMIGRVNELTNSNLDATHSTIKEVKDVTAAYLEQAEVLAYNAQIIGAIAGNDYKKSVINQALLGELDPAKAASILGFDEDKTKSFKEAVEKYMSGKGMQAMFGDYMNYNGADLTSGDIYNYRKGKYEHGGMIMEDARESAWELAGVLVDDEIAKLKKKYKPTTTPSKNNKNGNATDNFKDRVSNQITLQRELEDAMIANIEDEFERAEQTEIKRHQRYVQDREAELALLKEDDPRRAVILQQIEVDQETHDRNMLEIDEKYRQQIIKREEDEKKRKEQAKKEELNSEEKAFKEKQEIAKREFELTSHTAKEEKKFVMEQQMELLKWRMDHAAALGISPEMLEVMKQEYAKMQEMFNKGIYSTSTEKNNYSNIWEVLGFDMDSNQTSALNSVFDQAKAALNSWMDARKAAADQAKELADDEVSAAENALNREIELRNQGYANNVALRERELADAKEKQKQAVEEQKKIAQQQILLDAALQTSSLITATANIIKQFPNPLVWGPMLATMWGSFAFAKIKAYQASTKSIQFREGGVMLLEGGSHESGHDVNLGIGPDGSNLRAEGGEYFAVINKRNSRKYGSEIPAVVNAFNRGVFEDRYIKTSDAVGMMGNVGLMGNVGEAVDLSAVESGVGELVKQGESRWTVEGEYRVERYKNRVRRVKIG